MSESFTLTINPADILGVPADATLEQIREAYRNKAKRYHPDAGGEEWAFRILVQSYEMMSVARVTRATTREANAPPRNPGSRVSPSGPPPGSSHRPTGGASGFAHGHGHGHAHGPTPPPHGSDTGPRASHDPTEARESVRPGVQEAAADPSRVVDVEKLSIRYQADHVWLISEHGHDNRLLSVSLNLTWPCAEVKTPPEEIPGAEGVLKGLEIAFADVTTISGATSARSEVLSGRFNGWLSYKTSDDAVAAFNVLRRALHNAGLAVRQTSRDMVIPRQR
ncbi:MAG: J domain-containing protein [Isosphaeraceae bacterium]